MRKVLKASLIIFLTIVFQLNCFASDEIQVLVNGNTIKLQDRLVTKDGKVYISLRDIGEAFKFEFNWSEDMKTANLKNDEVIIGLQADNKWYSKKKRDSNLETYKFDEGSMPRAIDGKLYVPIGNFTLVAGGTVNWDSARKCYSIIYNPKLDYISNMKVATFAGTGTKGQHDGSLAESSFKFLQSVYTTKDKNVYVVDSGHLRKIINGNVHTMTLTPKNIKLTTLRGKDNAVYALSTAYENEKKSQVYSIFKVEDNKLQPVYTQNVGEGKIIDYDIVTSNLLVVLKEDLIAHQKVLELVNIKAGTVTTSVAVNQKLNCLAASEENIYLGSGELGCIYCYNVASGKTELWAGEENYHKYSDGSNPLFCKPRKLKYFDKCLYILDYNVLRKIPIGKDNKVETSRSIAGKVTTVISAVTSNGLANNILISSINPIDFDISGDGILFTDASVFKILKIN